MTDFHAHFLEKVKESPRILGSLPRELLTLEICKAAVERCISAVGDVPAEMWTAEWFNSVLKRSGDAGTYYNFFCEMPKEVVAKFLTYEQAKEIIQDSPKCIFELPEHSLNKYLCFIALYKLCYYRYEFKYSIDPIPKSYLEEANWKE